ncbi:MAG: hypothetical protein ACKOPE_06545, partial [Novosphingobium sp.]
MKKFGRQLLAGVAIAATAASWSTGAYAQSTAGDTSASDDKNSSEIIVTGSRIRRDPIDDPSPVVRIDSE